MKKRKALLVLKISATLALLLFLPVSVVLAGNPGNISPTEHLRGPAVIGEILLWNDSYSGVRYNFTGICKGKDVVMTDVPDPHTWEQITEDNLLYYELLYLPPEFNGCAPELDGGVPLPIITRVIDFQQFDEGSTTYRQASIIILFTVSK